jgi:hypothetical protein
MRGIACRPVASEGAGGALALQFLADQLTLSQPGGGGTLSPLSTTYMPHPPDFQTLQRP